MKSKHTKKALLVSVFSMLLCMVMLVGSTFAWFTDSVTSGKNKIVAGNLDVELNWSADGTTWERVTEDTDMFKDTLWEPGYTRVVYLQVENVGSLAFKYRFGINVAGKTIGKTADNKDIDLSDFIKFGVIDNAPIYTADDAGRAAARDAVKDTAVTVAAGYTYEGGQLSKEETSDVIALVVYMPEETGNEANYRGDVAPSVDLGINLVAAQYTEESDSFNDQYDVDAKYPIVVAINNAINQGALDSNAAIAEMLGKADFIYFDNALRTDKDGAKAITLHFSKGAMDDTSAVSAAVYAVIGLIDTAVDKEAANIYSVEIGHGRFEDDSNVMMIEGEPKGAIANGGAPESSWVANKLLAMVDTYGNLNDAFVAATTDGLDVEIVDMMGNSQIYRMYFDINLEA